MDVVTTSLEALIQRATNPQNQKPDIAATEAFCVMLTKEAEGAQIASKLLASHIQTNSEWEALQALDLLDTCMRRCGPTFHTEIGKFRFLNEMIKLVSPKYLGSRTPSPVREKVLHLLHSWTSEYPRETKIKEAYEMLKKQGVIKESTSPVSDTAESISKPVKVKNPIFEDEEKSKLLQKLLQSKNPDDLHAANRLIKTMVKEDEKRAQQNSRRVMELESVHNNVRLLSDMLDSYTPGQTATEDIELMKELYEACERLRPTILRLAHETQNNEEMLAEVVAASDDLEQVFDKYATVLLLNRSSSAAKPSVPNGPSLLDLSGPVDVFSAVTNSTTKISTNKSNDVNLMPVSPQSNMEMLGDIFSSLNNSPGTILAQDQPALLTNTAIMQPINIKNIPKKVVEETSKSVKVDSKTKALDDLNVLGESLLKESLSGSAAKGNFSILSKETSRLPLNSLAKPTTVDESSAFDKIGISNDICSSFVFNNSSNIKESSDSNKDVLNGDDMLIHVDPEISDNETNLESNALGDIKAHNRKDSKDNDVPLMFVNSEPEIKSLADINVSLENIKPGTVPPMTVIDEKNGITVVLHFAKEGPREDVSVIVVTTMSKNSQPLKDYLFQAVVPKKCKCRLQPPSGSELPAHSPFLPPSAITQIMLIANPQKEPVSLKFMLSYTMEDETVTEMGDVDKLPIT